MIEPIVIAPGGGEIVGDGADRRVEILSDHDSLHATWSRFGPGRDGADLHVHRLHTDLFYVLGGELTLRLGVEGEEARVPAGMLARVPPLVVHGFRNAADAEVRYLNLHAPGRGFADFMRALRDGRTFSYDQYPPPPDGGRPTTEAVIRGGEVLTDRPGRRVTLLADVEEIAIAEHVRAPGAPGAAPVHHDHVESLYVLEGELSLTFGDRELRAQAGSWLQVPARLPRAVSACGATPARYLELQSPAP